MVFFCFVSFFYVYLVGWNGLLVELVNYLWFSRLLNSVKFILFVKKVVVLIGGNVMLIEW